MMDLDFIRGKPRSVIAIKSDATYENIMHAVYNDQLDHKTLRATVQLCRANPDNVLCIVYRAMENSVLMLFGDRPECIRAEGTRLQDILATKVTEGNIYLFTYVRSDR